MSTMSTIPTAEFEPAHPAEATQPPGPTPPPPGEQPPAPEAGTSSRNEDAARAVREADDVLEAIVPSAEPRTQRILATNGDVAAEYVQKPLSFFRKMQFFKLLAKGLREAIDEGGPEALSDIFGGTTPDRSIQATLSQTDFSDAGSFMRFVTTVVEQAEGLMEEAYIIWLAVPPGQREWAKAAMRGDIQGIEPLSDEDGVAILKTFVVQNWGAMQAFFRVHAREVFEVAKAEQRRLSQDEG